MRSQSAKGNNPPTSHVIRPIQSAVVQKRPASSVKRPKTTTETNSMILFQDVNGTQCTFIDFGENYMGKPKVFEGTYVNNTPKTFSYKVIMRQGLHFNSTEMINLQTPNELGVEQSQRVIHVEPSSGIMEPYQTRIIKIICCGPINLKSQMQAKSFCFQLDNKNYDMVTEHKYSIMFEIDNQHFQPMIIHTQCKQVIPMVKLSRQVLSFGECDVNENRDILLQLENLHPTLKAEVQFQKVSCFFFKPEKVILHPNTTLPIVCTYTPKNLGKYNTVCEMHLLDGLFKIPVKLVGEATKIAKKRPQTRGTEARPQDFEIDPKFIDNEQLDYQKRRKIEIQEMHQGSKNPQLKVENQVNAYFLDSHKTLEVKPTDDPEIEARREENASKVKQLTENKTKYNTFLVDQRKSRLEKQRQQIMQTRVDEIHKKMKEHGITPRLDATDKPDQDPKLSAPVDYEFEFGLGDQIIVEPDLPLPTSKQPLYVVKAIDKYEPPRLHEDQRVIFKPDPDAVITKILPKEPTTHKQKLEISNSLSPDQLIKILAGPTKIDYGTIYVNSIMKKTFTIKNELKQAIQVRMLPDRDELKETPPTRQIIESSQTAMFAIAIHVMGLGQFKQTIKYVINEQHYFDILLIANVEAVNIEVSRTQVKFQFGDENTAFQTSEYIKLTNNGSGPASYKWLVGDNSKFFSIQTTQGTIAAHSNVDVQITYKPSNIIKDPHDPAQDALLNNLKVRDAINRVDDEKMVLKVTDGSDQQIKCIGFITDPKCTLKTTSIEMGEWAVFTAGKAQFQIKNPARTYACFKIISTNLSSAIQITPTQGKIHGEEVKDFTVRFFSEQAMQINQDIIIQFRSGRVLRLPFQVKSIVPKVKIEQSVFDFGKVTTLGNQGTLPLSIRNESSVPAELVFDLRHEDHNPDMQEGVQCLRIIQIENLDKSVLKSMQGDEQTQQNQTVGSDEEQDEELDGSKVYESEGKSNKKFFLVIQPNQTMNFELKIIPRELKKYQFFLPVELHKFGMIPGLKRVVSCIGCMPKFMVEPQHVDFGRKVILTPIEKNTPAIKEILLSNPESQSVSFRIDDSSLARDKIFEIIPKIGRVDGGQTLRVKVIFNPKLTGEYERSLNIYLEEGQNNNKPYLAITLSGVAAKPRILFDKREVILPPVPLGIQSKASFKIINDGFENMKLTYKTINEFQISFLDGDILGVTKQQLVVQVLFTGIKPISITSILEIVDQTQQSYSIALSATADNCVFTNFPYLVSHENAYQIAVQNPSEQFKSPLCLTELQQDVSFSDETEIHTRQRAHSSRKMTNNQVTFPDAGMSKEAIISGHEVMTSHDIQLKSDHLKRWLNYFILQTPLESFPGSIVASNGEQIFELITFLINRTAPNYKVSSSINDIKQREERIKLIFNQYKELLFSLKSEGALLNHIRPEYLLAYQDYSYYVKTMEANSVTNQNTLPQNVKLSQGRFDRLQVVAFMVLIYQILRLYYLPRVTVKSIKSHCPNFNAFEQNIAQSNVYGTTETLLIKWIETQYDIFFSVPTQGQQPPLRMMSLNGPLKDGHLLATLCLSYIGQGATKYFSPLGMIPKVNQRQDIHNNMQILVKAFQDVGIQTHFTLEDFKQMGYPETLLLLMTLFNTLPNYLPRQSPVLFSCILGSQVVKTIELNNPTGKAVSYWVKLDGSSDFSLDDDDNIKIAPRQTIKYKVRFSARVSDEQTARITFINKREGNAIVGAIVFDLSGVANGRVSDKIWTVTSTLYEQKEFTITVVNKFSTSEFGNFTIQLIPVKVPFPKMQQELTQNQEEKKKKPKSAYGAKEKKKEPISDQKELEKSYQEPFPAFFCKQDSIRLKRGASYNLNMQFIPLVFNQQKCNVVFQDPSVGEFQYELIGTVEPPDVLIDIKPNIQVFIDSPMTYTHHIPLHNPLLRRARRLVEQVIVDRKKQAPSKNKLSNLSNPYSSIPGGLQIDNIFQVVNEDDQAQSYVLTDKQMVIHNYREKDLIKQTSLQNDENLKSENGDELKLSFDEDEHGQVETDLTQNLLTFNLNFKTAIKDYISYFMLMSPDRVDVRRLRFTVTSIPKPVRATIEMTCPARESLIQEIPINNPSERDYVIKATITGVPEKNFTAFQVLQQAQNTNQNTQNGSINQQKQRQQSNKDHIIKKKTNGSIPLMFNPQWVCVAEAKLTISNPLTNDLFEYDLRGFAEEPLSEAHFTLQCLARHTQSHYIPITNSTDEAVTYTVFTDLVNATGLTTITIAPRSTFSYELSVTPMCSGQYTGQITFNDDANGTYRWFTITLETETPNSKATVSLVAAVGKAIAFDIELGNPSNEAVTIEVEYTGDGLTGSNHLTIMPRGTAVYQLIFSPKEVSHQKGNIAFLHPKLGEVWYGLELHGQEGHGVRLQKQDPIPENNIAVAVAPIKKKNTKK